MVSVDSVLKPMRSIGGFYAMALDTLVAMVTRPLAWREFFLQTWFVARVAIVPTLLLAIPFTVLVVFTLNVLLHEFGAADFSGTGAAQRRGHRDRADRHRARRRRHRSHRDVRRPRCPHHP